MAWWAWLLILWPVVAVVVAVCLGPALRISEQRDWVRRGSPERRRPRDDEPPGSLSCPQPVSPGGQRRGRP